MKSPHAPVSAEVDPLDREVNRALTTRFTCRMCIELRQTLSQYVARDRDRATARRIAADVFSEFCAGCFQELKKEMNDAE